MEEKETREMNELIKRMPNTIKFGAPSEKNTGSKSEPLDEWIKKIQQELMTTYFAFRELRCFSGHAENKKFKEMMDNRKFGKFVNIFQKNSELFIKIGDRALSLSVFPAPPYVEPIKDFISEQGNNQIDIVQQIIMQIAAIPITARIVRGKILYPEIEEMEKEIAELKEKIKSKNRQLKFGAETLAAHNHEIESVTSRTNDRIYAMLNEAKEE